MTFTKYQKFLLNHQKYRSSNYFKILYHKFSNQYFGRSNLKNFQSTSMKNLKKKKINFLFAYGLLVNSSKIQNLVPPYKFINLFKFYNFQLAGQAPTQLSRPNGCKQFYAKPWHKRWWGENSAYFKTNQTSNRFNIQAVFLQTYYQKYNFQLSTTIKNFIVPINQSHIIIRVKRQRFISNSLKGILLVNFPEKEKNFLIKNLAAENKIPLITQSASLLLKDSRNMDDLLGVDDPIQILFDKVKTCIPCICFINNLDSIGKQRYEQQQKSLHWLNYNISLLIKDNLMNKRGAKTDFGLRPSNLKLGDPKPKLATRYYHRLPIWLSNIKGSETEPVFNSKTGISSRSLKKAKWFGFYNNVNELQKEKVMVYLQSSSSVAWKLWVFDKNLKSPIQINFYQTLYRCANLNKIKLVSKKLKTISPSTFLLKTQMPFFILGQRIRCATGLKQQTVETKSLRFLSISDGLNSNSLSSRLTFRDCFSEVKEIKKQTSTYIYDPYLSSPELVFKNFLIPSNNSKILASQPLINKSEPISKKTDYTDSSQINLSRQNVGKQNYSFGLKHLGKTSSNKKKIPILTEKGSLISQSSGFDTSLSPKLLENTGGKPMGWGMMGAVKDLKFFFSATVFDDNQARSQILFKGVSGINSPFSPEWVQNPLGLFCHKKGKIGEGISKYPTKNVFNSTRQTITSNPKYRAAGKSLIKNKTSTTPHLLTNQVREDNKSNSFKISETEIIKRTALLKFLQILDGFHTPTEKKKSIFPPPSATPYLNLETPLREMVGENTSRADLSDIFLKLPKTIKSKPSKIKINHKHSSSIKNFKNPFVCQKKLKNDRYRLIINSMQKSLEFPYGITKLWMQLPKMNRFKSIKKNYLNTNPISFFYAFSKNSNLKTNILQFNFKKTRPLNFQSYKTHACFYIETSMAKILVGLNEPGRAPKKPKNPAAQPLKSFKNLKYPFITLREMVGKNYFSKLKKIETKKYDTHSLVMVNPLKNKFFNHISLKNTGFSFWPFNLKLRDQNQNGKRMISQLVGLQSIVSQRIKPQEKFHRKAFSNFEPILQTRGVPKWEIDLKNQPFNKSLNLLCVWPSYIEDILGPFNLNDAGSYILPEYFQLLGHGPKLKKQGISLIASTNNLTTLDAALLRPGRFDTIINFSYEFSSIDPSFNMKKHSACLTQNYRFSYYKSYNKEKSQINFSYKPLKFYQKFLDNKTKNLLFFFNNVILFSVILPFNLNKIDYGFKRPNQKWSGLNYNHEMLMSQLINKPTSSIFVSTLSDLHANSKKKLHTNFLTRCVTPKNNFKNQTKQVIINNFYSQLITFDRPNQSSPIKTFIDVSIFIQYKLWWNFHNEKLIWLRIDQKSLIQKSKTRVSSDEKFQTFKPTLYNTLLIIQSNIRNLTNIFIGILRRICFRFFYNVFQFSMILKTKLASRPLKNKPIVTSKTFFNPNYDNLRNGLPQEVLISKVLTLGLPKKLNSLDNFLSIDNVSKTRTSNLGSVLKTFFNTDASEFLKAFKNESANYQNEIPKNFLDTIQAKQNNIFLKHNRSLLFCKGDFDYKAYTKKDDSIVLASVFNSNHLHNTRYQSSSAKTSAHEAVTASWAFVYSDLDYKSRDESSSKTWKPFQTIAFKNVKINQVKLTKYNQIYKLKKIKFKQQFFLNLHPFTYLILKRWPEITKPNKLKQYLTVPLVNNILPQFNFPLYKKNKQSSSIIQNFSSLDLNKESPFSQIFHNMYSMTVLIPIHISLLKKESKTVTRDNFFSTYESYLLKKLTTNSSLNITCLQIYSTLTGFKTSKNWISSIHLPKVESRLKKVPRKTIFRHNNFQTTCKINYDNFITDQLSMKNNIVLLENNKLFLGSSFSSSVLPEPLQNSLCKRISQYPNVKKQDNKIKTRGELFFQNYKMCRLDVTFFLLTFYTMFFEKIQNKKNILNTIKIFMPYKSLIVSYFLLSQSSTYDFSCKNFEILIYNKFKNFLDPVF